MINLSTEQVALLLNEIVQDDGNSQDAALLIAKHFEDRVLVSGYCLSFALCKATSSPELRKEQAVRFAEFVEETFVELCTLDEDFICFMLSHVREAEITLPNQVRELHEKFLSFDYKDALRS